MNKTAKTVMNRPDYIRLRSMVKKMIKEMMAGPYLNLKPELFRGFKPGEVRKAWGSIVRDLNLVPEPRGGWTLEGHQMTDHQWDLYRAETYGVIPMIPEVEAEGPGNDSEGAEEEGVLPVKTRPGKKLLVATRGLSADEGER